MRYTAKATSVGSQASQEATEKWTELQVFTERLGSKHRSPIQDSLSSAEQDDQWQAREPCKGSRSFFPNDNSTLILSCPCTTGLNQKTENATAPSQIQTSRFLARWKTTVHVLYAMQRQPLHHNPQLQLQRYEMTAMSTINDRLYK